MKEENHPLYQLLLSNPSAFLEVKGEWSLSRLTSLLSDKSKIDAKLATEKYRLVKEAINAENLYNGNEESNDNFIGYKSRVKNIDPESPEVSIISDGLYKLVRRIYNDNTCIYPQHIGFTYKKAKCIKKIKPSSKKFLKFHFDHSIEVSYYKLNFCIYFLINHYFNVY
jgi:hypothetical protein